MNNTLSHRYRLYYMSNLVCEGRGIEALVMEERQNGLLVEGYDLTPIFWG